MKIMYCITSSSWGGAQLHVLELCRDQINRGNQVTFVVGNKGPLLTKVKQVPGVKTIVLKSLHREISPINDLKAIVKLRHLIKKENPDILHLHSSKAGTLGRIAAIGLHSKTKVVFTVHGWAFTDGVPSGTKKNIYKVIEKLMTPLADLIICVSDFDKKIGMKYKVLNGKTKVVVIHNGSPKPTVNKVNHVAHKPLRLVMIARFSKQKDQESLIKAVKKLPSAAYKLTFVGDGETLAYCKRLVSSLNLIPNIKFLGFKENVSPFLTENDIYILTSHYEGLPISIIEAMSYGLPIIASDVGGNDEMIKNGENGYLVDNVNDLTEAILKFINDPNKVKFMGEKSKEKFYDEYILETDMNNINKEYQKLLMSAK